MKNSQSLSNFLFSLVFVLVFISSESIFAEGKFQPPSPSSASKIVIKNPTSFILGVTMDGGPGRVVSRPIGIDCGSKCKTSFYPNTKVDLIAAPQTGYKVASWAGCDFQTGANPAIPKPANTCSVTMNASKAVSVKFQKENVEVACDNIFASKGLTVNLPLVEQGKTALKNHNIILADQLFCKAAQENKTDSQAAFACGLTTFLKIFESTQASQILTDMGELPINLQSDIFDTNGFFHLGQLYSQTPAKETYKDYPMMPFSNLVAQGYRNDEIVYHVLKELLGGNKTILGLQENLSGIAKQLAIVHNYLKVAGSDPNFAFRLPSEIFYQTNASSNGMPILRADVIYADVTIQAAAFMANLYYKYEPALDLAKIISLDCSSGPSSSSKECVRFFEDEVMNSLNGEYGPMFGDIKGTVGNFSELKADFENLLTSMESFVGAISKTCSSDFSYKGKDPVKVYYKQDQPTTTNPYGTTTLLLNQLKQSLTGAVVPLSLYNGKVSVNLKNFFDNPPDAKNITNPDLKPVIKTGIPCGPGQPAGLPCGETRKFNEAFIKEWLSGSIIFNNINDFDPTPLPPAQ